MLVLSRRPSEQIVIPDLGITLKIIAIRGNTVRLGIDAPSHVSILRGELIAANPDGSDTSQTQETAASPQAGQSEHGVGQHAPAQPKSNGRSKKKVYGKIGKNSGLRKYVRSNPTEELCATSEMTSETTADGGDVAVEDPPHQVGEEPALYRLSF